MQLLGAGLLWWLFAGFCLFFGLGGAELKKPNKKQQLGVKETK